MFVAVVGRNNSSSSSSYTIHRMMMIQSNRINSSSSRFSHLTSSSFLRQQQQHLLRHGSSTMRNFRRTLFGGANSSSCSMTRLGLAASAQPTTTKPTTTALVVGRRFRSTNNNDQYPTLEIQSRSKVKMVGQSAVMAGCITFLIVAYVTDFRFFGIWDWHAEIEAIEEKERESQQERLELLIDLASNTDVYPTMFEVRVIDTTVKVEGNFRMRDLYEGQILQVFSTAGEEKFAWWMARYVDPQTKKVTNVGWVPIDSVAICVPPKKWWQRLF